jgi:hypothetical protein
MPHQTAEWLGLLFSLSPRDDRVRAVKCCSVYPSYFRAHWDRDTEAFTSMQVGADYHHLHDDHFTHYATREDAYEVFEDAQRLYDWLEAKWQDANQPKEP